MEMKHKNLTLIILESEEEKEKHNGYTYLIQSNWTAHKAFRTEKGLNDWLEMTGLKIDYNDTTYGKNSFRLIGGYTVKSLLYHADGSQWDNELFRTWGNEQDLKPCEWLDNGEYTLGFIREMYNGGNIIYYLNVNCNRETFPYTWK